ncbi:unnamed protein product [Rangifer tarandus platyrhynchus]|uniref:Uncharacterized protein n=1 Tax=Rangifer tarandus platyrhynchus TaxID=3082113 RepID=A0ABN8ZE08_RANTA|nr:unnamed protein product [Rangifer tarandus platyrhynchus]CAI9689164.1 unnamed protein product [Rangifer tarandus platyrhynchus]
MIFFLRPLSRLSCKRKQPTQLRVYLQDNSAARRLGSGSDSARCPARALCPRPANSTGVPAAGPRGSPEPCPVDAPTSLAYLAPIPPPHQSLCSISPRALQTLCPSLHPLSASGREEPAAPPAPPKPAGERVARSRDPGTPPSAQRPGCPGTPSSQAKWPASRLLPG